MLPNVYTSSKTKLLNKSSKRKMKTRQLRLYFVLGFLLTFALYLLVSLEKLKNIMRYLDIDEPPAKIVIGAVSCRKENETLSNEETIVMMKSVLISALIYQIEQIEFHIFLEYEEDYIFFTDKLEEFNLDKKQLQVSIYFHSALDAVPGKYHEPMLYQAKFRCIYARLFFPSALPNVDSILYLDTDVLVTGNIMEFWSYLLKMKQDEMIGVVANNEPRSFPVKYKMHDCFKDVPFVHPKGLNSGLQLMNLTKMRAYQWEEKLLRLFDDYSRLVRLEDQRLINILLYYNPGLLHLLPCQFNIRCSPCDHGFICKDAEESFYGIQAVHGANNQFSPNRRFHYIYDHYKKFDLAKDNIMNDLVVPIRNSPEPSNKRIGWKCKRSINALLYKNLL